MNLIFKVKGPGELQEKDRRWAEAKFIKLSKLAAGSMVVEVTFEPKIGSKKGDQKKVTVTCELPHAKEPFHLEEIDYNFNKAVTAARDRFERYLKKYHDRVEIGSRFPRKFWFQKLFSRDEQDQ